ncbi:methyl-accepting chemotaxis protein [Desulfobacterales bacterium HSG2]|nr:methyl-accepting chemotaxis protein [Desulfobacterales bacterium HSG2]
MILFVTTIVLGSFGATDYFKTKSEMALDIETSSRIVIDRLAKTLAEPVWNFNMEETDKIIMTEMADKRIFAVLIRVEGNLVTARMRNEKWEIVQTDKDISGEFIRKQKKLLVGDEETGTVQVFYTFEFMRGALRDYMVTVIVRTLILDLILVVFLFVTIREGIVRPLRKIIRDLADAARDVEFSSGLLSKTGLHLSRLACDQAAALEETSAVIEEISSMSSRNSDNAEIANDLTKQTSAAVERSEVSMKGLADFMDAISRASHETLRIVRDIDEIAFQTRLLALNAAIEAARAGEAGAGFCVVAEEVKKLASRATDAAGNTSERIKSIIKEVEKGTVIAKSTRGDFSEVVGATAKTKSLIAGIACANKEQSVAISDSNRAIAEIEVITSQNAAASQEMAAASDDLSGLATGMMRFVNDLQNLISDKTVSNGRALKSSLRDDNRESLPAREADRFVQSSRNENENTSANAAYMTRKVGGNGNRKNHGSAKPLIRENLTDPIQKAEGNNMAKTGSVRQLAL